MTLLLFLGAWGKMIHGKKLKQNSLDTVALSMLSNSSQCGFVSLSVGVNLKITTVSSHA
jgi:hypothetical protein